MKFAQRLDFGWVGDSADGWTRAADQISLQRIDEADAEPRPAAVGRTYAELEYDALADEQEAMWPAEGERAARAQLVRARGLDCASEAAAFLLAQSEAEVREAQADHQHAARVLTPYVRREPLAKVRYWLCWPVFWLGDCGGVWSAAVANGDVPLVALFQALAAGLSGACAGLVGSELKNLQMARTRRRDPESLSEDERRYQRLFTATEDGIGIVKLVGLLSVTIVLLLAVAVFALRSSVEGDASGLTFGLLAAATAIGSCLLGYHAADEVADLLATTAKRARKAEQRHLKLAALEAPRVRAEADEAARSIHAEYALRGQAAGKRVESLSFRVLRRNPQVVGHGYPTGDAGGVIGRRSRRGTAA